MEAAVAALGATPRRVFLTQGRLQLAAFAAAPQHFYLVRAIDEPAELALLPQHKFVSARGPFALEDELALMREENIEFLVTKNSGGEATSAKIARRADIGRSGRGCRAPQGRRRRASFAARRGFALASRLIVRAP